MKKLKKYEDFIVEEVDIRNLLLGGAIVSGSLLSNPTMATKPPIQNSIETDQDTSFNIENSGINSFLDTIISENPNLLSGNIPLDGQAIEFGRFERLEYLINKKNDYESLTGKPIDLNLLSDTKSNLPFTINYFFVRGIDNIDTGPFLIQILKLDYNAVIELGGHKVMFNFTRIQDINTFGVKVNF